MEKKKEEEPVEVASSEETGEVQDATVDEGTKARTSGQVVPEVSEVSDQVGEAEGEAQDGEVDPMVEDPKNAREI